MLANMLDNVVTIMTSLSALLVALWRFAESSLGQALVSGLKSGSFLQARKVLEAQALCIAKKYQQTLVKGLKADAADGVITPEEMKKRLKEIKALALADFKASAEGGAVGSTLKILGVKDADQFLDQLLEGAVHTLSSSISASMGADATSKLQGLAGVAGIAAAALIKNAPETPVEAPPTEPSVAVVPAKEE